jgi:unsaturated rhamnogalacturonyl hydrolase
MLNFYYAQYCYTFNTPEYFDDVANQFILLEKHAKNPKTGLYYHGWDESKYQKWAHPQTGQSPEIWSRSVGWYAMALVEVLAIFPKKHPKRIQLIQILKDLAASLTTYQDKNTGVWYQITDKADKQGNYLEASGSTIFTYVLAKGVRLGFLDKKYTAIAQKGFDGILKNFVTIDFKGLIHIHQSCSGAGLGGMPYRAGDFDYYIHEPIRSDDLKTIGPFIHAALEMEKIGYSSKIVLSKKE